MAPDKKRVVKAMSKEAQKISKKEQPQQIYSKVVNSNETN
jgi:hypothetical protein